MIRYHVDVYDPYKIREVLPHQIGRMSLTKHAKEKVKACGILLEFPIKGAVPFEYYVEEAGIVKAVFRAPYNDEWDMCIALSFVSGKIVTIYLVQKNYHHENLDTSLYEGGA